MSGTDWFPAMIDMIANVGFPIFISLVLLHRMEDKLDAVVKALKDLTAVTEARHR